MEIRSGLAFHVHHEQLIEFCYDYDERVKYIKENKPKEEIPLRLKLLQIIPDSKIPGRDSREYEAYVKAREAYGKADEAYVKADEAYVKAHEAYAEADEAYVKAYEAYDKAREAYAEACKAYVRARGAYFTKYNKGIVALHGELCPDCPFDNRTIFTRRDKDGEWY